MTKKSIQLIGIIIGAESKDFQLYSEARTWADGVRPWEEGVRHFNYNSSNSSKGFDNVLQTLKDYRYQPGVEKAHFALVYDVSCPNKENSIRTLLQKINEIKKNQFKPILISIGHELIPLSKDISDQCLMKEVEKPEQGKRLLEDIISNEMNILKQSAEAVSAEHLPVEVEKPEPSETPPENNVDAALNSQQQSVQTARDEPVPAKKTNYTPMMIVSGFIAVLGILAVALAFTVLNAATLGISGLVVAGIGLAASLVGIGFFTNGALKNKPATGGLATSHIEEASFSGLHAP